MKALNTLSMVVAIVLVAKSTCADDLYFENFDGGNASRAVWTELSSPPPGTFDASSGDYVFTGRDEQNRDSAMVGIVTGVPEVANLTDSSARTRMSLQGTSVGVALILRVNLDNNTWYQGGYDPDDGWLYLGWNNPLYNDFDPVQFALFDFDLTAQDLMLQFDVIGNQLSLWAWAAGESMPDQPQLMFTDDAVKFASGSPGLLFDPSSIGSFSSATFRFIQVANTQIPEPSTVVPSVFVFVILALRQRKAS